MFFQLPPWAKKLSFFTGIQPLNFLIRNFLIRKPGACISLIYRANFDQTSSLGGVSKFGRNFGQTSTLAGRSLVEISTKFRHPHRSCAVRSAHCALRTQGYLEGYLRYLEGYLEGYLQQQMYTLKDTVSNNHEIYLDLPSMYMRYLEGPLGKQRYPKRYLEKHSEH